MAFRRQILSKGGSPCLKSTIIQRLLDPGVIAILRADSSDQLVAVTEALAEGGITAVEVTMTTPNALQMITEVTARYRGKILMGVGTVLDPETCRAAILAGAEFVVTPVTKPEVIRLCNRYGKPIINGAYTPTECLLGYESGADFIKLFPAEQLGPGYVRSLLAPLPMLQILPTGGITPELAGDYLRAGCVGVGVGLDSSSPKRRLANRRVRGDHQTRTGIRGGRFMRRRAGMNDAGKRPFRLPKIFRFPSFKSDYGRPATVTFATASSNSWPSPGINPSIRSNSPRIASRVNKLGAPRGPRRPWIPWSGKV